VLEERDPQGWALKALHEAGNSLLSEFSGLDDGALRRRPADDEWSLIEIAAHLRDAEDLAAAQISAIAEGRPGRLPAWDVDILPFERDYRSADLRSLLADFRRLRRRNTYVLWGLAANQWETGAEHPYRGSVTLGQIARELAQHDLQYLWQVRDLKRRIDERARDTE
jgi:hypothetical protein